MPARALLRLRQVGKTYGVADGMAGAREPVRALTGVDLDIAQGAFVAIMGASGSGKSTLLAILGGLDLPSEGRYCLDGCDVGQLDGAQLARVRSATVGFVFQQSLMLARMSALENVELPLRYAGVPAAERRRRALAALERVGMAERVHHTAAQLSGGQQQRVAIARALVGQPQLILADEPTGALDSQTSHEVMELLAGLHAQGLTVVVVTHEASVAHWAQRQLRFSDGRLVEDSAPWQAPALAPVQPAADPSPGASAPTQVPAVPPAHWAPASARRRLATLVQDATVAWRALRGNGLRSALTMLGVIIGVAAVVAMVAVGQGATERVQEQMKGLGTNLMLVLPGGVSQAGVRLGAQTRQRLTEDDALAMAAEIPEIQVAAPSSRGTGQLVVGNTNWGTSIFGVTNDYLEARDWSLAVGRLFDPAEQAGSAKVLLLGDRVARELFGAQDPLEQTVRVRNIPMRVVGVLAPKGQNASGQDQDDVILIPLSTLRNRVWGGDGASRSKRVWQITVKVRPGQDMAAVKDAIERLLRQRFKVPAGTDDPFEVRNLTELLQAQEESSRVMTWLLASIACISLLVGGIGIMNIMLVSVTERTREIGLRLAVGAQPRDILAQFLVESVTLCVLGGLAGVALGALATAAIGALAGWQVRLDGAAVALALGFSAAVGVGFGYVPARRAARLLPMEALRHE